METKSPINYIFVDYENVHDVNLALIGEKTVHLTLLLGAKQTKLDADLVAKLLDHAASVQLVRLRTSGQNALDFAVAYYLGRATNADPNAYFHIVSKDTGYDPLIEHLRDRRIHARRHTDYTTLSLSGPAKPVSPAQEEKMAAVVAHLRKNASNRPRKRKTLVSHLTTFSGKSATNTDVETLIKRLIKAGHLSIDEKDAVSYQLDL